MCNETSVKTQGHSKGMSNGDMTLFFRYMALYEENMLVPVRDTFSRVFLPQPWREKIDEENLRAWFRNMYNEKAPGLYEYILCRTSHTDRLLQEMLSNRPVSQIVILGAGFDSRAYRFDPIIKEKSIQVFELDLPGIQNLKIERLEQYLQDKGGMPSHVHFIPTDFNESNLLDSLLSHGYNQTKLTLFLWEGVTYYLLPEGVESTMAFIQKNSLTGSMLIFDYITRDFIEGNPKECYGAIECRNSMAENGQKFIFGIHREDLAGYLEKFGMSLLEHWTSEELGRRYLELKNGQMLGRVAGYMNYAFAEIL
ncbi:MAG: SAM-dependent methyltransferase [Clostridia bacterium]|nr:SAM-dependent methyltransferase [Clostridia bacterium]